MPCKIPQVKQTGGSSIAVKIRVVIGKCKMQNAGRTKKMLSDFPIG